MNLDWLGKYVSSNSTNVDNGTFTKSYGGFSLPVLWAFLERKKIMRAHQRYSRERDVTARLYDAGINTHRILDSDDKTLTLIVESVPLTDFPELFEDRSVALDDKLGLFYTALKTLKAIHDAGESHGDAYLKNFFKDERTTRREEVYTCDFELERKSPDPQITDLLMLTANAASSLGRNNPSAEGAVLDAVQEVNGTVHAYPLDLRDQAFYRLRFQMGEAFFGYFSKTRTISLPHQ
ncbi:hypothetical protein COV20_00925 [Candidatus Woesearchaeota archaeon CG10_big_fil_rev_8_21_14_0_10_45_16]|nr:MAG: hypothetical protein COV20_00925 [Candidatus Woesearchaeota archaeon CG10_big_fil_rev_8_21_14_0_10_45_16]